MTPFYITCNKMSMSFTLHLFIYFSLSHTSLLGFQSPLQIEPNMDYHYFLLWPAAASAYMVALPQSDLLPTHPPKNTASLSDLSLFSQQLVLRRCRLLFSCLVMPDSVISRTAAGQASLSFTISRSLLKHMSIESVMLSNQPSTKETNWLI